MFAGEGSSRAVAVFLFISYRIVQNGICICRLKVVLNSVYISSNKKQQTAAMATKSKLFSFCTKFHFLRRNCSEVPGSATTSILLDFWLTRAKRAFPFDPGCFRNFQPDILPNWKAPQVLEEWFDNFYAQNLSKAKKNLHWNLKKRDLRRENWLRAQAEYGTHTKTGLLIGSRRLVTPSFLESIEY